MFIGEGQVIIRLLVSAILSGLIGLEREAKHKPAGLRTNVLVGVGSTLIMLSSAFVGTQMGGDPGRIATGIVTGIGFLGAGLIIQDRDRVHGITTAGAIWMVSAIGIAVGIGFYVAAVFAALLTLFILGFSRDDKIPAAISNLLGKSKD